MFHTRPGVAYAALCLSPLSLVTVGSALAAGPAPAQVVARTVAAFSDVTDSTGRVWKARVGLVGGTTNSSALTGKDVLGTTEDALYQSSTYTSTGYTLPVPAGRYSVRLLMADGYWTKAGQRVFDVTAEGAPALAGVDIVGAVGRATAYDRTFAVDVTDGVLNLGFVKVVDNPLIAAVEVSLVGSAGEPSAPTSTTGTPTTNVPTTSTTSPISAPTTSIPTTSIPTTGTSASSTTATPSPSATSSTTQAPHVVARSIATYANVVDAAGNVWRSRAGFVGTDRNSRALVGVDIKGTTDDVLYRELTFGTTGYSVALTDGRYRVRLLMAEDYYSGAGKRVFDVTAQGAPALQRVDIAGAVGRAAAYDRTFEVDVTTGSLALRFVPVVDVPQFAAIEVARVGAAATPTSPPTTPTTTSPTATTTTTGTPSGVPTTPSEPTTTPPSSTTTTTTSTPSGVPTTPPDSTTTPPSSTTTTTTSAPTGVPTTPPATTTAPPETPTSSSPDSSTTTPTTTPTSPAPTSTTTTAPDLISDGTAPIPVGVGSPWITRIGDAPLDPNSAAMAANLRTDVLNNWGGIAAFNNTHYNTSFYRVPADQPRVDVDFVDCQNKRWVDPNLFTGPAFFKGVPIPADAQPAKGTDGELTIHDPATDQLWEFWQARRNPLSGNWEACWGGRIDAVSQGMGIFPRYYGATGTGVAMAAGMIGLDEVRRGSIDHAMYLGVMNAQSYPVMSWPALRTDGNLTDANVVREGQRLRLDPTLDLTQYDLTPVGRMVAQAAQRYGFVVSDRSGAVAVVTESGQRERALTGTDPWTALLGRWQPYEVMRNFPWEAIQVVESDWGRPADATLATPTPTTPPATPTTSSPTGGTGPTQP
ncbi:MAG: hypothetical protein IPK37_01720 [Austwickia sp.]|jgi:hypothetical protein|nr:MAG: hypothetical protein IPK37_01720 [Austwickia sp.]